MWGTVLPEAIRSRLIQPKLSPSSPFALLVMTRPCQAGATATLLSPVRSVSTITSVCCFRKATSSPKVDARAESIMDRAAGIAIKVAEKAFIGMELSPM